MCVLIHLIGQLHIRFGEKLVQERVPTRNSIGIQRGRPHVSARPLSASSLTVFSERKTRPESSCSTLSVGIVAGLSQIQEVCENGLQNRTKAEGARSKSWAGATEAHPIIYIGNNIVVHSEFENGAASHGSDCAQQDDVTSDSITHVSASKSDSVLLCVGDGKNDEPLVNADVPLSKSESSLLQLSETDGAMKHQSASFDMLALSGASLPLSASVPDLPQLRENGKMRKHDGFALPNLRSRLLGWKTDCAAITSSMPNIFHARNSPKQSRYELPLKPNKSKEKPLQKKEIILMLTSPRAMKIAEQDCEDRQTAVNTTSSLRSRGTAQMRGVGPQDEVDATKERALYDIRWNFPELRKRSCNNIARFALGYPLNDEQVQRQPRPKSSPADLRKSRQQLCVQCQQIVMLPCLVCLLALW